MLWFSIDAKDGLLEFLIILKSKKGRWLSISVSKVNHMELSKKFSNVHASWICLLDIPVSHKQELTNQGTYSYNKKQRSHCKFWNPTADNLTKNLILNQVEGSRSAPTINPNSKQSVMGWQWRECLWQCSPYIQISDVLCYKPISIICRTSLSETS